MAPNPDTAADQVTSRTYGDSCAIAHALDLFGERWALLIVRELLFGPKRFADLQTGVPNASPNVLTSRLRDLERATLIRKRRLGPPARVWVYELTEWGQRLEPILVQIGQWAAGSPFGERDGELGRDSLMLALKSHFRPDRAAKLRLSCLVRLAGDDFAVRVDNGRMSIARESVTAPDVTVVSDLAAFRALAINGEPGERITVTGDKVKFAKLVAALGPIG